MLPGSTSTPLVKDKKIGAYSVTGAALSKYATT